MVQPAPHSMTRARHAAPTAGDPRSLYDLEPADLARLVSEAGEPAYRARQLARRKVADPGAMTDLPAGFRGFLAERFTGAGLELQRHQVGDDGWTHKFLFALAGCAMGCTFCATGQFGFTRNLSAGEVVEQVARVWALLEQLRPSPAAPDHLTNVVFMGMGEPFANPSGTWPAAWRLHRGFGLSARAITISTVGLVPGIDRAAREGLPVNLAVSIHAATDELRDRLVPLNRTWPIAELLGSVRRYVAATRRRVSFEYALIRGVNDGADQADALGKLLAPLRVPGSGGHAAHVNLIPYNPTPSLGLDTPSRGTIHRFRDLVAAHGLAVSVRANRGVGIDAACGQLRTSAGRPGRTVELPLVAPAGGQMGSTTEAAG